MSERNLPLAFGPEGDWVSAQARMPDQFAPGVGSKQRLGAISIDPRAIGAAIKRNGWIILAILATALLLGMISILLTRPTYKATTSVQIDQQIAKVLGTEDNDQFQGSGDSERFLQTQTDVLRSRDLAERVVGKLKLVGDTAFMDAVGLRLKGEGVGSLGNNKAQTISALQRSVTVFMPRLSRVAQIGVSTHDRTISARLANAYAEAYIEGNLQRKFDQSSYSRKFLQDQLEQTRIKLEGSERSMVGFARAAGLIEITSNSASGDSLSSNQSLLTTDLVQFNQSLSQATAARITAAEQWRSAQAAPVMNIPEVLANPAIQFLTQQLAQSRVEYNQIRERLQREHPSALQKAASVESLERELQRQAQSVKNSIRDRFQVALRQEQSLAAKVNGLKQGTIGERDRSIQYNILRREVDTNRALYDALLQRYKEVSAQAGVTSNNVSVIDIAIPPERAISPRPLLNMALALLAGMTAASLAVFAREHFTDSVRTPEDVEARAELPLIGVTPNVQEGKTPLEEFKDPKTQYSEAIHTIRSALDLATTNGIPRSLALTSAKPAEGKSTLSLSLARELAKVGKRVILIDADLRAPSIHTLLGVQNKLGLAQYLANQSPLDDVIRKSDSSNLSVITSGPHPPDPTLLLGSERFKSLIPTLHENFDIVIFDCPPILGLADALQIGSNVAGLLVVIEASGTRLSILRTALRRLQANRIPVLGAVLSKFDAARFGYGEYYGYYYSHYGETKR